MTVGNPLGVAAGVALFEGLYSAAEGKPASVVVRDAVVSGALAYVGGRLVQPAVEAAAARLLTRGAKGAVQTTLREGVEVLPKSLPAPRRIEAHWGAGSYRHAGTLSSIEHVMYRHSWNTDFQNVSRFTEGTTARDIVRYVDEALRYGEVRSLRPGVYEVIHDLRRFIGVDMHGRPTSSLRVIVEDTVIRTAHPW